MAFWSGHCELCSRVRTITIMVFQAYSKSVVRFIIFRIYALPCIGIRPAKEMFVTYNTTEKTKAVVYKVSSYIFRLTAYNSIS